MGGISKTITAKTKTELKKKANKWIRDVKAGEMRDIRLGYDPKDVKKTTEGYEIKLWAHF